MDKSLNKEVLEFIRDEIDTVPHLEALLLLWTHRSKEWKADEMARAIFVEESTARGVLEDLARQGLINSLPNDSFSYVVGNREKDKLIEATDDLYRKNLVRIAHMIHSKAAAPVRAYARAFRFRKEDS